MPDQLIATKRWKYGFGTNVQGSIGAAINATKITKCLPMEGFSPTDEVHENIVSDRGRFGKGHDFATFRDIITKRMVIPQRAFSLSPLAAIWAPSMVLGDLISTDSVASGVYKHHFQFVDKYLAQECAYTSILEDAGSFKNLIVGAVVNQFTLDFDKTKHVNITWDGQAHSMAASVIATPAVTAEPCFFKALAGTFEFGESPAADISARILGGSLTFNQNPEVHYMPGETGGDIGRPSYFLIGVQGLSGYLRVQMLSRFRDLFLAQDECELIITLTGTEIATSGYYYQVEITIPHLKLSGAPMSEEGAWTALTLNFDDQSVLKDDVDELVDFAVQTDLASTDILAVSS